MEIVFNGKCNKLYLNHYDAKFPFPQAVHQWFNSKKSMIKPNSIINVAQYLNQEMFVIMPKMCKLDLFKTNDAIN